MPFGREKNSRNRPFSKEDKIPFYSDVCATAETRYSRKPLDAKNLSRWGEALIGLAVIKDNVESQKEMLRDSIKKLEEALSINDKMTETHFLLGNAYHKYGILTKDYDKAQPYYQSAYYSFRKAHNQDPKNEVYSEWMNMSQPCRISHKGWHDIRLRIITKRPLIDEEADGMEMMVKFGGMTIIAVAVGILAVGFGSLLQLL
ncbi:mitochondrial import receptor subunit TOM20-1-like [Tripterygium wilfordii]|uniref:mitochondrial import receptor subunit TOM20-1-like n=1 Tax=Tripterygium wilfordii TaxID=458696 RepID=UPI0018F7FCB7|nr:mitochondrial import receptor subunit TOM20-1-like [Tripterygium wilfordii]